MAVTIHINNVKKQYDDNVVISDLSIDIEPGELFTLLGPSGCGKTTLLRMIAGFNSIDRGTIAFDDQIINDIPVYRRNFGMVFQNYAIFPNMTVYGNIEYGLKNKRLSKKEIADRVERVLKVVQIEEFRDRYPDKLSGGQQQRVALARAVVVQPRVLLMDEPLSNLDAKLRVEMRGAISELQHNLGITTVYVTHDQEEALAISDRIAIMNKGDIYQCDCPERVYSRPYNTFVADFIGSSSAIRGTVISDGSTAVIEAENGHRLEMSNLVAVSEGQKVLLYIRPEEFLPATADEPHMVGRVKTRQFLGKYINYEVDFGTENLCEVSVDTSSAVEDFRPGDEMRARLNTRRINVFDEAAGTTLIEGVSSNTYWK